jgi:alkyl sulfatase BDS1-like metallo-beta-lactamase superfamily hydrolase
MCLQCGQEGLADGQTCPSCGLLIAEVLSATDAARPDEELLQAAREEFARGTCRRGLTLVNHVLRRNPRSEEAWSIKGQFFEYLGFRRALKAAMQEAVRLEGSGETRRDEGNGKRWWQFWK